MAQNFAKEIKNFAKSGHTIGVAHSLNITLIESMQALHKLKVRIQ